MSENTAVVTKKEPGMASLVIVLFAISAFTALVLGLVNMVTAPQIAINTQKKTDEAKAAVLASEVYEDVAYAGADTTIKNIWKAGDAGYVVEVTPSGFGGNLDVMVGVDNDGVCTGVSKSLTPRPPAWAQMPPRRPGAHSSSASLVRWPSPRTAARSRLSPAPPSPPARSPAALTPPLRPWPSWVKEGVTL